MEQRNRALLTSHVRTSIEWEDNDNVLFRSSRALLAGAAIAVLIGCRSSSGPTIPVADFFVGEGQGFLLRVGETGGVQTVTGEVFLINFANVLNDSRCPADVTCVDEGSATVVLSVQTSLALNDIEAPIPPSGTGEFEVEEITIEFIQLNPTAEEGVVIGLLDYELGIRVAVTSAIEIPQ